MASTRSSSCQSRDVPVSHESMGPGAVSSDDTQLSVGPQRAPGTELEIMAAVEVFTLVFWTAYGQSWAMMSGNAAPIRHPPVLDAAPREPACHVALAPRPRF